MVKTSPVKAALVERARDAADLEHLFHLLRDKPFALKRLSSNFAYGPDHSFVHNQRRGAKICVIDSRGFTANPANSQVANELDLNPEVQVISWGLPGSFGDPKNEAMVELDNYLASCKTPEFRELQVFYQAIKNSIVQSRIEIIDEVVDPETPVYEIGVSAGAGLNHAFAVASNGRVKGSWHDSSVGMSHRALLHEGVDPAIAEAVFAFGERHEEWDGFFGQLSPADKERYLASGLAEVAAETWGDSFAKNAVNFVTSTQAKLNTARARALFQVFNCYRKNFSYLSTTSRFCGQLDVSRDMVAEAALGESGYWTVLTGGGKDRIAPRDSFEFENRILDSTVAASYRFDGKYHSWFSEDIAAGRPLAKALVAAFVEHALADAQVLDQPDRRAALKKQFGEEFNRTIESFAPPESAKSPAQLVLQKAAEVAAAARSVQNGNFEFFGR